MNAVAKRSGAAYGWVGILAVAVFVCAWIAAYSAESSWVWGTSRIEDLGISTTKNVAQYFNYGCILTGVLLAAYGAGKTTFDDSIGCGVSSIFTILAGVSIVFIGIFTKNYYDGDFLHFFACLAAVFVSASLVAESIGLWVCGGSKRALAGIGIIIALTVTVVYFTFDFALFESYAVVLALFWFAIDACTYLGTQLAVGRRKEVACRWPDPSKRASGSPCSADCSRSAPWPTTSSSAVPGIP